MLPSKLSLPTLTLCGLLGGVSVVNADAVATRFPVVHPLSLYALYVYVVPAVSPVSVAVVPDCADEQDVCGPVSAW